MKKFQEWLKENHPESIDEGWMKNALLAGTAAAGLWGAGHAFDRTPANNTRSSVSQGQDDFDTDDEFGGVMDKQRKLQAAAERVGIPRGQWNNLKGQMTGGIVTVVNGKRVPLTPKEMRQVKAVQNIARSMGN